MKDMLGFHVTKKLHLHRIHVCKIVFDTDTTFFLNDGLNGFIKTTPDEVKECLHLQDLGHQAGRPRSDGRRLCQGLRLLLLCWLP
jgi:hypothetical protein